MLFRGYILLRNPIAKPGKMVHEFYKKKKTKIDYKKDKKKKGSGGRGGGLSTTSKYAHCILVIEMKP